MTSILLPDAVEGTAPAHRGRHRRWLRRKRNSLSSLILISFFSHQNEWEEITQLISSTFLAVQTPFENLAAEIAAAVNYLVDNGMDSHYHQSYIVVSICSRIIVVHSCTGFVTRKVSEEEGEVLKPSNLGNATYAIPQFALIDTHLPSPPLPSL
jgi:hypothetical protein